ncbi:hypothetical protein GCM10007392_26260 [Saccharospirillum salsuginis]|uniref:Uncharacterized protein n=1 Tax=Saccharospirillum salsuginis TaxID=418750 RepID=A0A918KBX5_9GAMM|nr:hypothetical protein GCM10007392_26260 [Saccharospirillum salsuginis]
MIGVISPYPHNLIARPALRPGVDTVGSGHRPDINMPDDPLYLTLIQLARQIDEPGPGWGLYIHGAVSTT